MTRVGTRRLSAEARREQLLDAAKAVVAEHGFHGVSIEAVARGAGGRSSTGISTISAPCWTR
jgi:AcrR family transcriptional regulator